MSDTNINSKEYWNNRFASGSWDEWQGENQSLFFARVAVESLPDRITHMLEENALSFIDYGCAEGAGTAYIAYHFPSLNVTGVDFSEEAIRKASSQHPHCAFKVGDLTGDLKEYDIVFSSNTIEHLNNPRAILERMVGSARKAAIIILPFEDEMGINEHFHTFGIGFFPAEIGNHILTYFRIIDCRDMKNTLWPGKQILLVYALSSENRAISMSELYREWIGETVEKRYKLLQSMEQMEAQHRQLEESLRIKLRKQHEEALNQLKKQHEEALKQLKKQHEAAMEGQRRQIRDSIIRFMVQKSEQTALALNRIDAFSHSKPYRLAHFMVEAWHAFFGTKDERALGKKYLFKSRETITSCNYMHQMKEMAIELGDTSALKDKETRPSDPPSYSVDFLSQTYDKYDVIVFGIIDYDFRYQRPQHIADHFVRQGHRVFYINATFRQDSDMKIESRGDLKLVTLQSALGAVYALNDPEESRRIDAQLDRLMRGQGIRDAIMIADYPTWVDEIIYLKKRYGFSLVTDYMDDFTGFLTTTDEYVKEDCIALLKASDGVVASSQYLLEVVSKYASNVSVIRNATEYAHFHQAYQEQPTPKKRKVIGYYGAIAEWFDFGKIKYLSRTFPDCDIVLIGNVTNPEVQQTELPNVKKLGEKPYAELPGYLKDFDVCLIPFDTSTNLIKATNPVKFYEYLSAGKKIVATEIPEIEPYRDKYVYLANDDETFAEYVRLCLEGGDALEDAQSCMAFALENDWQYRVDSFERFAEQLFPKVSIIVLCYNQLDYTRQCVESILRNTAYANYELVIVDNNSEDGTADYLRRMEASDSRIKIVLNRKNRGFAGGNNDGIAASSGEYIVLLNNDTLVTRGWLTSMVKRFRASDTTGIVGAVTNSIGNEAKIEVDYEDVADMPAFAYRYTAEHMGEEYPHDGVLAMFCVMFSRRLIDEIGVLDENYGIGMFEDDDYSIAAKRAGYDLILPEDVFVHHYGSVSFKTLDDEVHRKTFEENKAYFEKKWNMKWQTHHDRTR